MRKVKEKGWVVGRIRPTQGELFADRNRYHCFAVVSKMWSWEGERLLRWQRERCGLRLKALCFHLLEVAGRFMVHSHRVYRKRKISPLFYYLKALRIIAS